MFRMLRFKPFLTGVCILHPLKTTEKQRFSGVFRGYENRTLIRNELNHKLFFHNLSSQACFRALSNIYEGAFSGKIILIALNKFLPAT